MNSALQLYTVLLLIPDLIQISGLRGPRVGPKMLNSLSPPLFPLSWGSSINDVCTDGGGGVSQNKDKLTMTKADKVPLKCPPTRYSALQIIVLLLMGRGLLVQVDVRIYTTCSPRRQCYNTGLHPGYCPVN